MSYIIKNNERDTYLVYNLNGGLNIHWTKNAETASKFDSMGKAQNFLLHNYRPYLKKSKQQEEDMKVIELFPEKKTIAEEPRKETPAPANPKPRAEINTFEEARTCLDSLPSPGQLAAQINGLMKYASDVLSLADQEKNDILHKIELEEKLNAAQRAMLFKQLREILQWRRTCKDMVALLRQYNESGFVTACVRLDAKLDNFREQLANREYTPRILLDLFEDSPAA